MPRRRTRLWPIATLALVAIGCVALLLRWNGNVDGAGRIARVTIPKGATLTDAADSLQHARVIRTATIFLLDARLRGRGDDSVQAGRYLVTRGTSTERLLDQLQRGSDRFRRLTIPEGWGIQQIARLMHDSLGIDTTALRAVTRDPVRRARMKTTASDLEGYLFPATYEFTDGTTAAGVVDTMLLTFERRWKNAWDTTLARQGRRRHDVVTLASIVEKEAGRDEDRPMIASVYMNRLRKGMRLQADPTVLYAMKLVAKRVLYADLRTESLYNTYRVAGLPPGPIASPGTASLAAVIEPPTNDALFFVAFPDGHSQFTKSFAEHAVAVKAARAARDAAGPMR